MKANYTNVYPKVQKDKNGNNIIGKNGRAVVTNVFVYHVTGTEEELTAYKDAQGALYRESDEGKPLFFSPQFAGDEVTIIITSNGRVVADTSMFKKAESLAGQYDFMKDHIAAAVVESLGFGKVSTQRTVSAPSSNVGQGNQAPAGNESNLVEGLDSF